MMQSVIANRSLVSMISWMLAMSCSPAAIVPKPETAKDAVTKTATSRERPTKCPAPKIKGQPEFCQSGEDLYVVGLAPGQGVDRGERMLLEVAFVDGGYKEAVGMIAVMEPRNDFAKVALLYQRPGTRLSGASASKIKKDERVRLGKFIARIEEKKSGRLRLDVGLKDGAVEGDVYEVLSRQDYRPIGRLRITELEDFSVWAISLDQDEPFVVGQDATFLKSRGEQLQAQPVLIAVVNFDPRDEMDKREAGAGRSFAKDLADALAKAADGADGISVKYLPDERIKLGQGDKEAHASAREVGRQHGAQIVVWGSMRCSERGCALPRFTVVCPDQFRHSNYLGEEVWLKDDGAGYSLKEIPPGEPMTLAAAMLGEIAFNAQRYGDAVYYLTRAAGKGVLQGDDELEAFRQLVYANHIKGQNTRARQIALRLVTLAKEQGSMYWQARARGELGRIDAMEGEVVSAQGHFQAALEWARAQDFQELQAFSMNSLGLLEESQGRVTKARKLYEQSLELYKHIGDIDGQAATLSNLGLLEESQGRVAKARKLYEQSLELNMRIGDIGGQAVTLSNLGVLERSQGRVTEARKRLEQSLELSKRIGDIGGQAATLNNLGGLEKSQGRVTKARKLYEQSFELSKLIGYIGGQATTLNNLGELEDFQGRVTEARKLYELSQELYKRIGDIGGQATTLINLGWLKESQGIVTEARKLYELSQELYKRIGHIGGQAMTLNNLGRIEESQGRVTEARGLYEQSLELNKRIGDIGGQALALNNLGLLEHSQGRETEARGLYEQSLKLRKRIGSIEGQAVTLNNLGGLEKSQGRVTKARKLYEQSLELHKRIGNFAGSIVSAVNLAVLEIEEGDTAAGRRILVEQLTLAKSIQHVSHQAHILDLLGQADEMLGDLKSARKSWFEAKALFAQLKMIEQADQLADRLSQLNVREKVAQSQKTLPELLVDRGVVITEVFADGQAARAGIAPGDILLRYGQTKLNRPELLQTLVKSHDPRKEVAIEAVRGDKKKRFKVHGGLLGVDIESVPTPSKKVKE